MRIKQICWLLALIAFRGEAQQLPQYSLFAHNPFAYNPAAAGSEDDLVGSALYRRQWVNLEGAPTTYHFNAHLPIYALRSGFGVKVENDLIGAHRTTLGVVAWNYQIDLGKATSLSFGLGAGYMGYTLDGALLRAPDGVYNEPGGPVLHNDPRLPEGLVAAGAPVFEFGVFFRRRSLNIGLAALPVFAPELREHNNGALRVQPQRHYALMGIYRLEMSENLSLQPAIFAKTDLIAFQSEISASVYWQDNIFAGISYRGFTPNSRDALVISAGMRLNERARLAYAYDHTLSALSAAQRGTHEIMLRYSVNNPAGVGKLPPIIYNPRFY